MIRYSYMTTVIFVLFLAGCSSSIPTDAKSIDQTMINKSEAVSVNVTTPNMDAEHPLETLVQAQKVSVITSDGYEMVLDDYSWLQTIIDNLGQFTKTASQDHSYTYTLIIRSDHSNPLVMRISNDSVAIADQTYSSGILPQVVLDIKGSIGRQMLTDLSIEQAAIFMLDDGNQPLVIADEEMLELKKLIASAKLIHENTDIRFPLFPNYVIQIFNGDKTVINLDVISNNIISVPYGNDQAFYYYLDENIYDRFYRMFPPFDYLDDHPKSLFAASSIEIVDSLGNSTLFGIEDQITTIDDAITDSFARLLVDGIKLDSTTEELEQLYVLIFKDNNQKKMVRIYMDGFKYKDRFYHMRGIGDRVRNHLKSLSI